MNKLVLTLTAALAVTGVQAIAQTMVEDTDGNGTYSLEELQAVFADLTQESFDAADSNADGAIDADELAAAQEAGLIPA